MTNNSNIRHLFRHLFRMFPLSLIIVMLFAGGQGWTKDELLQKHIVRMPAGAGTYYPADASELYDLVGKLINDGPPVGCKGVKAILVPHAGYVYSGSVTAAAFREVDRDFRRVFVLAANHNSSVDFNGVSIPRFTHYSIPDAEIPLDDLVDELIKDQLFVHEPDAHTGYMVEVELPFLHYLGERSKPPGFTLIPMILGRMTPEAVKHLSLILNHYADSRTLYVFSVDLSHYYDDKQAGKLDMQTIQSIMSLDSPALRHAATDGNQVLLTMVELAELNGLEPTFLKYRNSGEVTGDRSRVVGYASVAFHEPFSLSAEEQQVLIAFARSTIESLLKGKKIEDPEKAYLDKHPILHIPRGVFVTLEKNGRLRGCIGEIISQKPLYKGIRNCAIKSATKDPRFKPVNEMELDQISISIAVLGYPCRVKVPDPASYPKILRPGKDGVILVYKGRQSTYLPKVWEDLPKPVEFLSRLCLKQGAPENCWLDKDTVLYRYGSYDFSE